MHPRLLNLGYAGNALARSVGGKGSNAHGVMFGAWVCAFQKDTPVYHGGSLSMTTPSIDPSRIILGYDLMTLSGFN